MHALYYSWFRTILCLLVVLLNNWVLADGPVKQHHGLIVKRDRFEVVWPAFPGHVKAYYVDWSVNASEPVRKQHGPSERSSEFSMSNDCVKLSAAITVDVEGGSQQHLKPITFDGTTVRPIKPQINHNGGHVFVDWSRNWPCGANTYDITVTGKSGNIIYTDQTTRTNLTLSNWKHCEPADLCIQAHGQPGENHGHACIEGLMPEHRGKPSNVEVKLKKSKLTITWALPDACEPRNLNILLKSHNRSQILTTLAPTQRNWVTSEPEDCKICLIYVIASYPDFHDEMSEAAVYVAPEFDLHPKPGPVWDKSVDECRVDSHRQFHAVVDQAPIVHFYLRKGDNYATARSLHASWINVTTCPVIQFRLHFTHIDKSTPKSQDYFIEGDTCVALNANTMAHLTVTGLTSDSRNIPTNQITLHPDDTESFTEGYKICSVHRREIHIEQVDRTDMNFTHLHHLPAIEKAT